MTDKHLLFDVFQRVGYAGRISAYLADNWSRMFLVKKSLENEMILVIEVIDRVGDRLPNIQGVYRFNLQTQETDANSVVISELIQVLDIPKFAPFEKVILPKASLH